MTAAGSSLEVVTETEYDHAGRKTADVDPLGLRTEYVHDAQGRLSAVVLPEAAHPTLTDGGGPLMVRPRYEYTYDARGNQVTIRDNVYQIGADVYYDHDGTPIDPGDPPTELFDTRVTQLAYDCQSRQISRTLPLGVATPGDPDDYTETFDYDDFGRQVLHVSFEGAVTHSVYDDSLAGGGRLAEQRFFPTLADYNDPAGHPSEVWLYAYDAFGREVSVKRQTLNESGEEVASTLTESTYDDQGRLTCKSTPQGTIYYEYDVLGRKLRTFTGSPAQVDHDWRYTYDALGRLAEVSVYARNGSPVDISGEEGVQPEATRYHYDLVGNLDWQRYANGLVTDYEYDGLNRLEKLSHFAGAFEDLPLPAPGESLFAGKGKGVGSLYSGSGRGRRGRPRGRSVDSKPKRFAVLCCHGPSPNGAPRTTDRRNASSSASVCAAWTCSRQRLGIGTGPSSTSPAGLPCTRCQRLDQRQASTSSTSFARKGFLSTYRSTARRWSSSWIGKDLKRPW